MGIFEISGLVARELLWIAANLWKDVSMDNRNPEQMTLVDLERARELIAQGKTREALLLILQGVTLFLHHLREQLDGVRSNLPRGLTGMNQQTVTEKKEQACPNREEPKGKKNLLH